MRRSDWFLPLLFLAGACGGNAVVWQQRPSPVQNLPARFNLDPDHPPAPGSKGCAAYLLDERDQTHLLLARSVAVPPTPERDVAVGDYRVVPSGRYGLGPTELLRVQCPSGRPQGAVH